MFVIDKATLTEIIVRVEREQHYREQVVPRMQQQVAEANADAEWAADIADRRGRQLRECQITAGRWRTITLGLASATLLSVATTIAVVTLH